MECGPATQEILASREGAHQLPLHPPMHRLSSIPNPTQTQVSSGSAVCHDATSLLAIQFPYAAPRPTTCAANIVMTPLTTLLTNSNLTVAMVLEALNLPAGFKLLTTNTLAVREGPGQLGWPGCICKGSRHKV